MVRGGIGLPRYREKNSSSQLKNACLSSGDKFAQSILSMPASSDWTLFTGGGGAKLRGGGEGWSGRVSRRTRGGGPGASPPDIDGGGLGDTLLALLLNDLGGGRGGGPGLTPFSWLTLLVERARVEVADAPNLRTGTGGLLVTLGALLADEPVLEGGGGGLYTGFAKGAGGGGGLALTSAFQFMFLLGWLDIRSLVLERELTPASLTLTALLRNSSAMCHTDAKGRWWVHRCEATMAEEIRFTHCTWSIWTMLTC